MTSELILSNTAIICLSPTNGGMEMDSFRIAKLLSEKTQTTLIAKENSFIEKEYGNTASDFGINLETISFNKNFSISIILGVRKILKEKNIKNVIFFGASELKSLYFSFYGLNINLLIRHGTTKGTSKKDFLHRLLYSNVNYHLVICKHLEKNVRKIIPFGKNTQLKLIYSSLRNMPADLRESKKCTDRPIILLHIARITDGKGQIDAIKACQILYELKKDFKLYLVGDIDPDYNEKLTSALNNVPYKNSIKLEGFSSDVSEYYRKSDIFIFPSKGEGLSNSFIEALSYGLACISYNNTSFPELKTLGFNFHLAEDQNIGSLKDTLQTTVDYIENDPIPIDENITLAKRLFSTERELQEYIDILI